MVAAPPLLRNIDLLPRFFKAAADSGLPVVIQDEPAATGVTMPVSVLVAAADASGARCVKVEDPPTPAKIGQLLASRPDLTLFGGLGGVAGLHELQRGAAGTMTGFAYPGVMRAVREKVQQSRRDEAARIFDRFLPLIVFEAQVGVGLLVRKEVLRRRGVISTGTTRSIVDQLDRTTADELDEVLSMVGVTPSPDALVLVVAPPPE